MIRLGLNSRNTLLASVGLIGLALGSTANAQVQEQQTPPQQEQSATDADGGEIIITAQKREERSRMFRSRSVSSIRSRY